MSLINRPFWPGLLVSFVALASSGTAVAQSSPSDFTTGLRYDLDRRVVGTIAPDPDGAGPIRFGAVRNTYDASGNLTRVEKGELAQWQPENIAPSAWPDFTVQQTVDYSYDLDRRKTAEVLSSAGTTKGVTHYAYDSSDRLACQAVRMDPAQWSGQTNACVPQLGGANGPDRITTRSYYLAGYLAQEQRAARTDLRQLRLFLERQAEHHHRRERQQDPV